MKPSSLPKVKEYLYAQCSCKDFEFKQHRLYEHSDFAERFKSSRQVHVARHSDYLVPPLILTNLVPPQLRVDECDERWAVWQDEMNILYAQTVTRDKVSRTNRVSVTLKSGAPTEWVCKHILCVARWIFRHKFQSRHVYACWEHDPDIVDKVKWAQHQAGGLIGAKWIRLTNQVWVGGWGHDMNVQKSNLFEQKGEEDGMDKI